MNYIDLFSANRINFSLKKLHIMFEFSPKVIKSMTMNSNIGGEIVHSEPLD